MTVSLSVNSAGILEKALTLLHFIFTQQRRVFMPCVPDPDLDPEREKRGRSGEGRPSGFGRFQVQKGPESAAAQRMEKPTAAHNPEVVGSSPAPATTKTPLSSRKAVFFFAFCNFFGRPNFLDTGVTQTVTHTGQKTCPEAVFLPPGSRSFGRDFLMFTVPPSGLFP